MFIDFVVLIGDFTELIDPRTANGPHEAFQVVARVNEDAGERVEQLRVGRWVGLAHVVLRLDDAAVEEVFPVAVDE